MARESPSNRELTPSTRRSFASSNSITKRPSGALPRPLTCPPLPSSGASQPWKMQGSFVGMSPSSSRAKLDSRSRQSSKSIFAMSAPIRWMPPRSCSGGTRGSAGLLCHWRYEFCPYHRHARHGDLRRHHPAAFLGKRRRFQFSIFGDSGSGEDRHRLGHRVISIVAGAALDTLSGGRIGGRY